MNADPPFHHLGILTPDLAETCKLYVADFGYTKESPLSEITSLGIRACSLARNNAPRLELIEPMDPDSPMGKRARQSAGGYHLAWLVSSVEQAAKQYGTRGFHAMPVFHSPLWNNARCLFMVGPDRQLVEFIEQADR